MYKIFFIIEYVKTPLSREFHSKHYNKQDDYVHFITDKWQKLIDYLMFKLGVLEWKYTSLSSLSHFLY